METLCSTDTMTCTICNKEQDLAQFGIRKNGRRYYQCKSCKTIIAAKWNRENAIRRLAVHATSRAKKFGIPCDIDSDWVLQNIQDACPCCHQNYILGKPQGRGRIRERRPSLDRFNPEFGYTKANTRIICFKCNRTKNEGDAEHHEQIAKWMRAGGPMKWLDFIDGDGI